MAVLINSMWSVDETGAVLGKQAIGDAPRRRRNAVPEINFVKGAMGVSRRQRSEPQATLTTRVATRVSLHNSTAETNQSRFTPVDRRRRDTPSLQTSGHLAWTSIGIGSTTRTDTTSKSWPKSLRILSNASSPAVGIRDSGIVVDEYAPEHPDYHNFSGPIALGGFASVWQATQKATGRDVVIKTAFKLSRSFGIDGCNEAMREADIIKSLRHPNIIEILATPAITGSFETLVMEHMRGGDLLNLMQKPSFDFELHSCFMVQLTDAVAYIHSKGIVHGDIKLENVLVSSDLTTIKLSDFGLSARAGEVRVGVAEGTTAYMAPELIAVPRGAQYTSDFSTDVYSLGVAFHAFIFAFLPWNRADSWDKHYRLFTSTIGWQLPEWTVLQANFRDCLLSMLGIRDIRIPITNVVVAVRGRWLNHFSGIEEGSDEDE